MVWVVTTRLPAPSRTKPLKRPPLWFTAKVWICWLVENVLISRRNCPLKRTPGMELLPRVSWTRPTTPVLAPTYTARLIAPVSEPRNGMVVPTAPSTLKYAVPVGSMAAVIPMKPLSVRTPPIVSWAWIVALT